MSQVFWPSGSRREPFRAKSFETSTYRPFLLSRETVFFVAMSLLDLGATIFLISQPSTSFYESNPIAAWVLLTWGVRGMAVYKLSLVSLVCCIGWIIAVQQRDTARKLMTTATAIVSCVVIYSAVLYMGVSSHDHLIALLQ